MRTAGYLELLRKLTETGSDYAISKLLGETRQKISGYKNKGITFGPEICEKVAEILEIPLEVVLADMEAERAKRAPIRKAWEHTADILRKSAAAMLVGVLLVAGAGNPAPAEASIPADNNKYYAPYGW